ncbi:MAG: hypothetical protein WCP06_03480 [Verrucomicrobiota bacterium]
MSRHTLVIFPAPGPEWELWACNGPRRGGLSEPVFRETTNDPAAAAKSATGVIVALPVSQCLTFSTWLPGSDASLFADMVFSQIERRGLATRARGELVFDYAVITQEDGRPLVRITLLAADFPEALCLRNAKAFLISPALLALAENQIIIWQEQNQLILAASRDGELVHTQVLSRDNQLLPEMAGDIQAVRVSLELERTVEQINGITLWGDFQNAEQSLASLKLPIIRASRPAPSSKCIAGAAAKSGLLPGPLRATRAASADRARSLRLGLGSLAAYAILVWMLWIYLHSLRVKRDQLAASMASDGPIATELGRTAACWRAIEPAVNPKLYAIEQFYQCSRTLPPAGIRFSIFETMGTDIRMKGIARNAPTLYRFVDELKRNRELSSYQWKMGQPKLQKDDSAEFKLEGSLTYGKAK